MLTIFADGADGADSPLQVVAVDTGRAVPVPRAGAGVAAGVTPGWGTCKEGMISQGIRLFSLHYNSCLNHWNADVLSSCSMIHSAVQQHISTA